MSKRSAYVAGWVRKNTGGAKYARPSTALVVGAPYGRMPTSYRGIRRFRGPFRTGGFGPRTHGELKVIDTAQAAYTTDSTAEIVLMNGVSTGTDFTNRVGRKIIMKSIQCRFYWNNTGTNSITAPTTQNTRVMVVYDHQSNGAAPAMTDILTASNSTSFMNLNNRERFKVIYDKAVTIVPSWYQGGAYQNGFGSSPVQAINIYKRVNLPVVYEGTAATIGSVASGALWLIVCGDAANVGLTLIGNMRVRFNDA